MRPISTLIPLPLSAVKLRPQKEGSDSYQNSESQLAGVKAGKYLVMCSSDFPCKGVCTQSDEIMNRDALASSLKVIKKDRRVVEVSTSWRNLALVLGNASSPRVDKLPGRIGT